MNLDLEKIRSHYSTLDNETIESIAKKDAATLEAEVIPILVAEIKKRRLDRNLLLGVEAQRKILSKEEFEEIYDKITNLPCPECGKSESNLNGVLLRETVSFILFSTYSQIPFIACNSCAKQAKDDAYYTTLLFGWWAFPHGIFHTISSIIGTINDKKHKEALSKSILTAFILENLGEIKINWNNPTNIIELIKNINHKKK